MHRDVLEQMPIFRQIAEGAAVLLVRNMKPLTSSPGDHIVDEGTVGNEMYFLTHGKVEVLHQGSRSEGEPRAKVCELAPGDYFGEIALLDTSLPGVPTNRRLATVRSMEFCELRSVEKDDLAECFEDFPEMLETMMGLVRARISELMDLNAAGSDRKESPAGDSSFGRSLAEGRRLKSAAERLVMEARHHKENLTQALGTVKTLRAMSHHGRGHLALAVAGMSRAGSLRRIKAGRGLTTFAMAVSAMPRRTTAATLRTRRNASETSTRCLPSLIRLTKGLTTCLVPPPSPGHPSSWRALRSRCWLRRCVSSSSRSNSRSIGAERASLLWPLRQRMQTES